MGETNERDLSPDEVYDEMEVLEPYTAGELASRFGAPKQRIRRLLERLSDSNKVWKKEPDVRPRDLDPRGAGSRVCQLRVQVRSEVSTPGSLVSPILPSLQDPGVSGRLTLMMRRIPVRCPSARGAITGEVIRSEPDYIVAGTYRRDRWKQFLEGVLDPNQNSERLIGDETGIEVVTDAGSDSDNT